MRGASQFQQLTSLSPPLSGEALREESTEASLRDSRAGQRLPRGPLWPALGSPQEVQAWWLRTDDEVGVDVTEAVAERVDIIGALVGADTTVTVAVLEAIGTVAKVEAAEAGAAREMGATDAEAGRNTGAGAVVLAAETVAAEEFTGREREVGVTQAAWWAAARCLLRSFSALPR